SHATALATPAGHLLCLQCSAARRALPSFPTRRSSDLGDLRDDVHDVPVCRRPRLTEVRSEFHLRTPILPARRCFRHETPIALRSDRKSTRLNSSHSQISYAVFCLKKKR